MEELQQINLAAIERNQREILVVDVDVVLAVGFRKAVFEHVVVDEVLRALGAELQHDAHRGIRVDVRVVALEVGVLGRRKEDVLIRLHQVLLRLAALRMALAVRDIAFRDIVEVILHELLLDHVLDFFDRDILALLEVPFDLARDFVDVFRRHLRIAVAVRARDGMIDLLPVVGHCESRAFRYRLQHGLPRLPDIGAAFPPCIYILWSAFCLTGIYCSRWRRRVQYQIDERSRFM